MGYKPKGWTEEDTRKREAVLEAWWDKNKYGGKVPNELRKWYLEDVTRDLEGALTYLRTEEPEVYKRTTIYKNRRADARKYLLEVFQEVPEFLVDDFLDDHAHRIAMLNPDRKFEDIVTTLLRKKLINSKAFSQNHPALGAWLKANGYGGGLEEITVEQLNAYMKVRRDLIEAWKKYNKGNGYKPPSDEILNLALRDNWDTDRLYDEFMRSADYGSTGTYQDKAAKFKQFWDNNMGSASVTEGSYEAALDAYARSSIEKVDDWMEIHGVNTSWWDSAFPEWNEWFANYDDDPIADFEDFLRERRVFIDAWNQIFRDGSEIDPDLLSRAMRERWDRGFFEKQVMSLPKYAATPEAQDKGKRFDAYWYSIMGEGAPVDEAVRQKYITSASSDTSLLWDDIKQTSLFRAQFPNWEAFAASQFASGVNVTNDPAKYNAYKKAMYDAFAETGTFIPPGLENEIFGSGLSERDIEQGVGTWSVGKDSLAIVGGEQADLRTSLGLKDKVVGGQLRDRLRNAIEAHEKYLNSDTAKYRVRESGQSELVTQKI